MLIKPVSVLQRMEPRLKQAMSAWVLEGTGEDTSTAHEKMELALEIDKYPNKKMPAQYLVRDEVNSKAHFNEFLNRIECEVQAKWEPCHISIHDGRFFLEDVCPICEVYANGELAVPTENVFKWSRRPPLNITFTVSAADVTTNPSKNTGTKGTTYKKWERGPKFRTRKGFAPSKNSRCPWRFSSRGG